MKHKAGETCPSCDEKLMFAHPKLGDWFRKVKARYPGVHVSWSFRNEAEQNEALAEGKSKLAWPNSAHNHKPSLAIDLFQIDDQGRGVWNPVFMARLDMEFPGLKWGGGWVKWPDNDHFELPADQV